MPNPPYKPSPPSPVTAQRRAIAPLFDESNPAEAPTAYYALHHEPSRSALYLHEQEGKVDSFVGRFQTGIDLFRPLIVMRCTSPEVAADLLSQACVVGRPYLLFSPADQLPLVGGSMAISNTRTLSIYANEGTHFSPVINVLVMNKTAPDGTPRAEIHSGGLQAAAGVNWQSPLYAELYVHTEAEARNRGWGRSVAAAVTERVLGNGRTPVYLVEPENEHSVALAIGLGYRDTGARQIFCDAVYEGHPAHKT